jgi:hypothetical protein
LMFILRAKCTQKTLKIIKWTTHLFQSAPSHMGVNLCRA